MLFLWTYNDLSHLTFFNFAILIYDIININSNNQYKQKSSGVLSDF